MSYDVGIHREAVVNSELYSALPSVYISKAQVISGGRQLR